MRVEHLVRCRLGTLYPLMLSRLLEHQIPVDIVVTVQPATPHSVPMRPPITPPRFVHINPLLTTRPRSASCASYDLSGNASFARNNHFDAEWMTLLTDGVRRYAQMHSIVLLTHSECQHAIRACTAELRKEMWMLQRNTAAYLATEAFGRLYYEVSRRMVHDFQRFGRTLRDLGGSTKGGADVSSA